MRKTFYFCVCFCLYVLFFLFSGCQDEPFRGSTGVTRITSFSMEEAKSSFECQMRHAFPVVSRASVSGRRRFGSPGDFVPLWDKSSCSVQGHLSCYSVPFENDVRYKAFRSEYRHGKASAYGVNVY